METVGWIATILVAVVIAFGFGYWFGYKCGQQDAEDGVKEP